jgi:hypothetical protein
VGVTNPHNSIFAIKPNKLDGFYLSHQLPSEQTPMPLKTKDARVKSMRLLLRYIFDKMLKKAKGA